MTEQELQRAIPKIAGVIAAIVAIPAIMKVTSNSVSVRECVKMAIDAGEAVAKAASSGKFNG